MLEVDPTELRAEAARCSQIAKASNLPYVRRSFAKIAELYDGVATWVDEEVAAGRLSRDTTS